MFFFPLTRSRTVFSKYVEVIVSALSLVRSRVRLTPSQMVSGLRVFALGCRGQKNVFPGNGPVVFIRGLVFFPGVGPDERCLDRRLDNVVFGIVDDDLNVLDFFQIRGQQGVAQCRT